MRKIDTIVIHCSATPVKMNIGVKEIRSWHLDRGWRDIGYHYVVRRDGSIEEGRNIEAIGAHVKGHNATSVGVCYVGGVDVNGKPEDNRTDKQKESLIWIVDELQTIYGEMKVCGHRDFKGVVKACPSFDVKKEF